VILYTYLLCVSLFLPNPKSIRNRMNKLSNGWFSELGQLWPGQCMSLEVEEILFHEKSQYQDVLVFKSKTYGNVLVLDGVIQVTERDEFSYQETMAHLPIFAHSNPKKVLIIGGGDGGILREVCKHKEVEEITMCEIDKMVIEVSKKYLPQTSIGFIDSRVTVHYGDGAAYMKEKKGEFDIILVDSSDPIGPAESLFEQSFYECMKDALRPNGTVCCQGECVWIHLGLIKNLLDFCKPMFAHAEYAYTSIPTYPCGQIGFIIGSLGDSCKKPKRKCEIANLKYYNAQIHEASFVLPEFARKVLEG